MKLFRQGDILLVPADGIPAGAKKVRPERKGRHVLAKGEVTNHDHSITCSPDVELLQSQEELFLLVKQGDALLEHQEHATITVQPGAYRVIRQREYSPEEIRRVAD